MAKFGAINNSQYVDRDFHNNTWASAEYMAWYVSAVSTILTVSDGDCRLCPIYIGQTTTVDRIAVDITVGGSAGAVIRFGIYNDSNGAPSSLVLDAGTVAATGTGITAATISQSLTEGFYWLAAAVQGAPATHPTVRSINGATTGGGIRLPGATAFNTIRFAARETGLTGAMPSTSAATVNVFAAFLIALRKA